MSIFTVRKSLAFSAAHALRDYDGPCARTHGHNYRVEVELCGEKTGDDELLIDFYTVDKILEPLIAKLDHQFINEIPPFTQINPTAEAIAAWFYREFSLSLPPGPTKLKAVHLWETEDSCASYSESD